MAFDPDAFLSSGQPEAEKTFDPDAFLSASGSVQAPQVQQAIAVPQTTQAPIQDPRLARTEAKFQELVGLGVPEKAARREAERLGYDSSRAADFITGDSRKTELTESLPELQNSGLLVGESLGKTAALAPVLATTTNPGEIAKIITSNFPNVGVTYNKDGEGNVFPVLVNNETGAATVINRPGISGMDVLQMMGIGAAYTPAGMTSGALRMGGAAALTEAGMQGAQAVSGGDFNIEDVALSGALGGAIPAAPAAAKAMARPFQNEIKKRKRIKGILDAATPNDIVDEAFDIVKTGGQDARSRLDQLVISDDALVSVHPTVREIKKLVNDGKGPDEVAEFIGQQKDLGSKGEAAKYRLEGEKLKKSKTAQELIRQGMAGNDVQLIASASDADKVAFTKILDRVKGGMESSRVKNKLHPQAVVGDSVLERLNYVQSKNKDAGERIKAVANSELKGKNISLNEPLENFKSKLDELGVTFDNGRMDFEGSALMDLPKLQAPLKRIINRLDPSRNPNIDAMDAHNLKKWFDTNINYGKTPTGGGMEPEVERAIKGFRADINKALGDLSPKYKQVNTQYADTIGAINDLKNLAGKRRSLSGDFADETLGMLSKRVTSNAMSRGQVSEAIEALENVSAKYGKVFKDDIATQVQVVNAIEKKLGAFSDASLMGQVQAPIMRAGSGGTSGAIGDLINVGKAIKNKMNPVDEAAYIKALEDLINGK